MIAAHRRRDRLGIGLVAYGVAGLVLLALAAVALGAALGSAERLASADPSDPGGLAARLDRVVASLDESDTALRGFDATLGSTADAARDGRRLSERLADSLRSLGSALDLSVLGTQPFAGLRGEFGAVADDADALAADLATTAGSLDANRASLARLGDEVAGLRADVAAVRAELGGSGDDGAGGGLRGTLGIVRLVVAALLAWLAVPAAAAIVVGARRLRTTRPRRPAGLPGPGDPAA